MNPIFVKVDDSLSKHCDVKMSGELGHGLYNGKQLRKPGEVIGPFFGQVKVFRHEEIVDETYFFASSVAEVVVEIK